MTRRSIIIATIVALAVWGAMQSCKTKKEIVSASAIETKLSEELFVDIIDKQFDFNTFSSKLNLNLSSGKKSLSSRSNIKILKDQAIQLSVQPLFGVEMLRLHLDKDSLLILDRMNKRYVKESINDIKDEYPVGFDFTTLQSLLTNRIFVSGSNSTSYSDFGKFKTNQISDKYYLMKSTDKKSGIEYSFAIDGNDHIASAQLREPRKNYELEWQYDEFIRNHQKVFPHKMNVMFATPKRKANVGLEFSNIVLDEQLDVDVTIPKSYSRAYISDIVKILNSN